MRRSTLPLAASSLLLSIHLAACGGGGEPSSSPAPAAAEPSPAPAAGEPAPLPGPPPLPSRGGPPAVAAQTAAAAGLAWDLPQGWQAEPPTSSMRLAQAVFPGPGGPAELTIFFFGAGGGGGVEANIERWIGQVETTAEPRQESFETNGLRVTWVEVEGTLLPSGMGTGPTTPQPGSRLYGAVVEGPGGPWFFKATGPAATLAAQRDAFLGLLKGLRAQ